MDDRASGLMIPKRSARAILAWALVVLGAWLRPVLADDFGDPYAPATLTSPLGPQWPADSILTSTRLPPITEQYAGEAILAGFETSGAGFGARQVAFATAAPTTPFATAPLVTPPAPGTRKYGRAIFPVKTQPTVRPAAQAGSQQPDTNSQEEEKKEGEEPAEGGEPRTYGRAPENNTLQFLRTEDVLLKPGAWQFDTGFVYTLFDNDFPLPVVNGSGQLVNVVEAHLRRRLLYTPLAVRYGWSKNVQLFSFLPAGFSDTQISAVGVSNTINVSGIGDLVGGASIHLIKGEEQMPDVIGTIGFTAPTGKFSTPLFGLVPGSNLGQGFWALSGQLLFIHRYDPVIVFYGGGYRHLFERDFSGQLFQPGEQINYQVGFGFAVNDRITFSTALLGFYITNTFINNENIRGTNLEPISLRLAATISRNCKLFEPFFLLGATDFAPNAQLGIVITFY